MAAILKKYIDDFQTTYLIFSSFGKDKVISQFILGDLGVLWHRSLHLLNEIQYNKNVGNA